MHTHEHFPYLLTGCCGLVGARVPSGHHRGRLVRPSLHLESLQREAECSGPSSWPRTLCDLEESGHITGHCDGAAARWEATWVQQRSTL